MPAQVAEAPDLSDLTATLWRVVVNFVVRSHDFEPSRLLACFDVEGQSRPGMCTAIVPVTLPTGYLHLVAETHGEGENLHYHLLLTLDLVPGGVPSEARVWDDLLRCIGQQIPGEIQAMLSAYAFLPETRWETALGLPRAATGLVPGLPDGVVSLSGIELDLSKSTLPLETLFVSTRSGEIEISLGYRRNLVFSSLSGMELLREAAELARLFVVERISEEDSQ